MERIVCEFGVPNHGTMTTEFANALAGPVVPKARREVVASADQEVAIGTEGEAAYGLGVSSQASEIFLVGPFPEMNEAIFGSRGKDLGVQG